MCYQLCTPQGSHGVTERLHTPELTGLQPPCTHASLRTWAKVHGGFSPILFLLPVRPGQALTVRLSVLTALGSWACRECSGQRGCGPLTALPGNQSQITCPGPLGIMRLVCSFIHLSFLPFITCLLTHCGRIRRILTSFYKVLRKYHTL